MKCKVEESKKKKLNVSSDRNVTERNEKTKLFVFILQTGNSSRSTVQDFDHQLIEWLYLNTSNIFLLFFYLNLGNRRKVFSFTFSFCFRHVFQKCLVSRQQWERKQGKQPMDLFRLDILYAFVLIHSFPLFVAG